jgi:hypothetical protein
MMYRKAKPRGTVNPVRKKCSRKSREALRRNNSVVCACVVCRHSIVKMIDIGVCIKK